MSRNSTYCPRQLYCLGSATLVTTLLLLASLVGPCKAEPDATAASSHALGKTVWWPLRVGGGGWLTGIDISADGTTRVVRTDTYGAYVWDSRRSHWRQLVNKLSMPAANDAVDVNAGVYEIRVAPTLPTRLYMAYRGYVYRSDDGGSQWRQTTFPRVPMDANDEFRMTGPKMAVDPANPDVVYVGTGQSGLFVTTDGGNLWQLVTSVPKASPSDKGQHPGYAGIVFDPSSGTTGVKTNRIYAGSYGHGVWVSDDAGVTWARTTDGPTNIRRVAVAPDGTLFATDNDRSAKNTWKRTGGTWTNLNIGTYHSIAIDPSNPSRIILATDGGTINQTRDGGATWSGNYWPAYPQNSGVRVAPDVPWLAWTNESWMSNGDMRFDPITPNLLWFAEGIGVWYTNPPVNYTGFNWYSLTAGIEQLVANVIVAPPGGGPLLASWDRPVFHIEDPSAFPLTHGPDNQKAIVMGWALDYASSDPRFVVGLFNYWSVEKSGYSQDGGRSWHSFASYPPLTSNGKISGSIAASTPKNFVWAPANNGSPYYTLDGGETWKLISAPGVSTTGETGWGWAYYLNRHIVTADRVNHGTFYIYNYLTGLYRSTDGGANWMRVRAGAIAPFSGYNALLRAVPDQAGHLFFTSGPQGTKGHSHPAASPFMRSTDGGSKWTPIPGMLEVRAFGFGKGRNDYPTIFAVGWFKREYGIWRSDDNARSWVKIGEYPLGSLDNIKTVEGDKNAYGTVYVGFNGSGYAYGMISP